MTGSPFIVGLGGTQRSGSSSEAALRTALTAARDAGCEVECFSAERLELPLYNPGDSRRTPAAEALVESLRRASGVILASPGYHGTISGMVKNAIDYVEDMVHDETRTYLDGLPVGCIAVAYGWQAAVNTLTALRDVVHALRGFPTPYGAAINASTSPFDGGQCTDDAVRAGLMTVGDQVASFALRLQATAAA
jgi:FMN reductase